MLSLQNTILRRGFRLTDARQSFFHRRAMVSLHRALVTYGPIGRGFGARPVTRRHNDFLVESVRAQVVLVPIAASL